MYDPCTDARQSYCSVQVLFARAMQSAGLKTITSKHLSLAAQCLSFLDALVPNLEVDSLYRG